MVEFHWLILKPSVDLEEVLIYIVMGAYFTSIYRVLKALKRLRNENKDKTKTNMTQSFNQYSENETKIWHQNILIKSIQLCVFFLFSFSFCNFLYYHPLSSILVSTILRTMNHCF